MTAPAPVTEREAPPNSLRAIFDSIEAAMRLKMPALNLKVPTMGYGRQALKHMNTAPRIVCVPTRGKCGPTLNRSGRGDDTAWKLWGRNVVLNWYVWDVDETATEVLANHLVAAIHDLSGGYYEPVGEEWGESQDTKLGDEVIVGISFYTTWSREFLPTVDKPNMEITGQVTQPTH
jgi:hypothetical protein